MKKASILFIAMMLSAGMAFAQSNDASITQSGDDNSATVGQSGSDHEAIVDQSTWGTGHTAEVTQSGGSDSYSYILQDQRGAEAYVSQVGSNNISGLKQSGPNVANISQDGNGNVLGQYSNLSNNAFQKNGTSFPNDMNWLTLNQTGDDNLAGVWQEHHAEASITQIGNRNDSRVYQSGQSGGAINSASVSVFGDDNSTDIYQSGEGNSASVSVGPYQSDSNVISTNQVGDGNAASFSVQRGDGNDVDIDQDGSANYSEYSVKYGSSNTITADVTGVGNRTRLGIDAGWGSMSSSNTLSVTKSGDNNYLSGSIEGSSNMVTVLQDGTGNRIGTSWYTSNGVSITGDSNLVGITQMSDSNSASVSVAGSNNSATISQN